MAEEWRAIDGSGGRYQVSDQGRVRSLNRVLKPSPTAKGYMRVTIWVRGETKHRKIHQLVAEAFIGPCPEGQEINHKNTDRSDNRAENLEYLTRKENAEHAIKQGRQNRKVSREDVLLLRSTTTPNKAEARRLGVSPKHIRQIRSGKSWPDHLL